MTTEIALTFGLIFDKKTSATEIFHLNPSNVLLLFARVYQSPPRRLEPVRQEYQDRRRNSYEREPSPKQSAYYDVSSFRLFEKSR